MAEKTQRPRSTKRQAEKYRAKLTIVREQKEDIFTGFSEYSYLFDLFRRALRNKKAIVRVPGEEGIIYKSLLEDFERRKLIYKTSGDRYRFTNSGLSAVAETTSFFALF